MQVRWPLGRVGQRCELGLHPLEVGLECMVEVLGVQEVVPVTEHNAGDGRRSGICLAPGNLIPAWFDGGQKRRSRAGRESIDRRVSRVPAVVGRVLQRECDRTVG